MTRSEWKQQFKSLVQELAGIAQRFHDLMLNYPRKDGDPPDVQTLRQDVKEVHHECELIASGLSLRRLWELLRLMPSTGKRANLLEDKTWRKVEFDIGTAKSFFPGAFDVLKVTQHLAQTRFKSNDNHHVLGTVACHLIILGHTIELLLKTKIQAEGGEIKPIHNLYDLFNSLKDDSKICVEDMYKKLETSELSKEDQRYGSIESLLKSHSEFHTEWRYIIENKGETHASTHCLLLAAGCIYKMLVEKITQ